MMIEFILNLTECVIGSLTGKCLQFPGNQILNLEALTRPLFLPEVVRFTTEEVCASEVVSTVGVVKTTSDLVLKQTDTGKKQTRHI